MIDRCPRRPAPGTTTPVTDADASAELERTAYHEAGHAVVGVILIGNPGRVTVVPDGNYLGMATTERVQSLESLSEDRVSEDALTRRLAERHARDRARLSLAERAAETERFGRADRRATKSWFPGGDAYDAAAYLAVARGAPRDSLEHLGIVTAIEFRRELRRTRRLLRANWRAIHALAARLMLERTLDARAVEDTIHAAMPRLVPPPLEPRGPCNSAARATATLR